MACRCDSPFFDGNVKSVSSCLSQRILSMVLTSTKLFLPEKKKSKTEQNRKPTLRRWAKQWLFHPNYVSGKQKWWSQETSPTPERVKREGCHLAIVERAWVLVPWDPRHLARTEYFTETDRGTWNGQYDTSHYVSFVEIIVDEQRTSSTWEITRAWSIPKMCSKEFSLKSHTSRSHQPHLPAPPAQLNKFTSFLGQSF